MVSFARKKLTWFFGFWLGKNLNLFFDKILFQKKCTNFLLNFKLPWTSKWHYKNLSFQTQTKFKCISSLKKNGSHMFFWWNKCSRREITGIWILLSLERLTCFFGSRFRCWRLIWSQVFLTFPPHLAPFCSSSVLGQTMVSPLCLWGCIAAMKKGRGSTNALLVH